MSTTLDAKDANLMATLDYLDRRLPIVVCPPNSKRPMGRKWQDRMWTADEVIREFSRNGGGNVGLILGPRSGIIDIECDSDEAERDFAALFTDVDAPVTPTYASRRGKHRLFRWDDRFGDIGKAEFKFNELEIRLGADGKAAQSLLPPSCTDGHTRRWLPGCSLDDVDPAPLPDEVIRRILMLIQSNEESNKEKERPRTATGDGNQPGDDYNSKTKWADILEPHGWTVVETRGDVTHWKRPDKDGDGASATTGYCGDRLFVFSTNAEPFESEKAYSKFAAYALLNHAGDFSAAAAELARQGYGTPREYTDVGNGVRFAAQHGEDVRYCHPWRKWLVWDGRRWRIDGTGEIARRAKQTARSIHSEAADSPNESEQKAIVKFAIASQRRERLNAMIAMAASESGVPVLPHELDRNPWLLNVENGIVDLTTGKLSKHERRSMLTKIAPVRYEMGADCPMWMAFLRRIMGDNKELIGYLQRLAGYCLTGSVEEHILPVLYGTGANGKSTFVGTILKLLGQDYAMQGTEHLLMAQKHEQHPTMLADLFGKRFVGAIETEGNRRLAESRVKMLTGGDRIRARRCKEDFWEFEPTHKVWLATNHKPVIRGDDDGIWRRVKLIPFTVRIPDDEQDKSLPTKLATELPGILMWALSGCLQWQHEGLGEPSEVTEATGRYKADMDIVGQFLAECCTFADGEETTKHDLHAAFVDWGGKMSQRALVAKLRERGFPEGRVTAGPQKGRQSIIGIRLTSEESGCGEVGEVTSG